MAIRAPDGANKDALGEDESTHLPIVWDKVSNKSVFFLTPSLSMSRQHVKYELTNVLLGK